MPLPPSMTSAFLVPVDLKTVTDARTRGVPGGSFPQQVSSQLFIHAADVRHRKDRERGIHGRP